MIKIYPKKKRGKHRAGIIALWALFTLMGNFSESWAAHRASTNYQITDVLSGGGSASSSASYSNQYSIAQTGMVGSAASPGSGLQIESGFWPMVNEVTCLPDGDVNADGVTDILKATDSGYPRFYLGDGDLHKSFQSWEKLKVWP